MPRLDFFLHSVDDIVREVEGLMPRTNQKELLSLDQIYGYLESCYQSFLVFL